MANYMTNEILLNRLKRILEQENFFDIVQDLYRFEKEYKNSAFYQATKMNLIDAVKLYKQFNILDLNKLFAQLQEKINTLDLSHFNDILDKIGETFNQENTEILSEIEEIKKLREEE